MCSPAFSFCFVALTLACFLSWGWGYSRWAFVGFFTIRKVNVGRKKVVYLRNFVIEIKAIISDVEVVSLIVVLIMDVLAIIPMSTTPFSMIVVALLCLEFLILWPFFTALLLLW